MRFVFAAVFAFFCSLSYSQPINDECVNAIDLGISPICDTINLFDNINATPSDVGQSNVPPCFLGGTADDDVWFSFTTTDAFRYTFTVQGVPDSANMDTFGLFNPEIALYSGTCDTNDLTLLPHCASAPNQVNTISLVTEDLLPNTTYLIRINSSGVDGINEGHFHLCIEEEDDKYRVDEEGSNLCEGLLFDTGGPDSTYGNNEDFIFTICPEDENQCIELIMGEYTMEYKTSGGDYFIIYDGADTNGIIVGASFDWRDTTGKNFTPDGFNKSVCQSFRASSGCMTILWHTDSSRVEDGFSATWQCSADSCILYDTLQVDIAPNEDQIIGAIQGQLLEITKAQANCADTAFAYFEGDSSDLGIMQGVLLTTGRIDEIARPNTLPNTGSIMGFPGVPLLDSLSLVYEDSTTTHDGCSLDMDFTPDTDVIAIEFTMGSEEYPECIVDGETDILGLFYNTLGFTDGDPRLDGYRNIAVVPNVDSIDIQISTVNQNSQPDYYWNNINGQSVEFDGLLANGSGGQKFVLLTQNVTPCQDNHLLAAIADRGDSLYDSGIFLWNMRCLTPEMGFIASTGLNFFIEECNPGDDFVTINFPRLYDVDTEWDLSFSGSATEGVDFIWPTGNTVILPANQSQVRLPIDVIDDGIDEGQETISMKLTRDWGCGAVELAELDINIRDRLIVEIDPSDDPAYACKGVPFELIARGDLDLLNMKWTPEELFENAELNLVNPILEDDVQIVLTGTIIGNAGCTWSDTINIEVLDPQVRINALDPVGICRGESVRLEAVNNNNDENILWSPNVNISSTTDRQVTVTPDNTTIYVVEVDTLGCKKRDSIAILVDVLDFPVVINETTICAGDNIQLATSINSQFTTYLWTPSTDLNDPTQSGPVATPTDTITYKLVAKSQRGFCIDSAEVTINVINIGVDVIPDTTLSICLGDETTLRAILDGDGDLRWSPTRGILSDPTSETITVSPDRDTRYRAIYTKEQQCDVSDDVLVLVDSLPTGGIIAFPEKESHCKGDSIRFSLRNFNPSDFRNLNLNWSSSNGTIEIDSVTNEAILIANNNQTITVTMTNGQCMGSFEYDVTVIDFGIMIIDTTTRPPCDSSEQLIRIMVEVDTVAPNIEYNWSWSSPNNGVVFFSCTDCPDPLVGLDKGGGKLCVQVTIGDCTDSDSIRISDSNVGLPVVSASADSIGNCSEVTAFLDIVNEMGKNAEIVQIIWEYREREGSVIRLSDEREFSITYSPSKSGKFAVKIIDEFGCESDHFMENDIEVTNPILAEKQWNAITPNNDGQNDIFKISYVTDFEWEVKSFTVFNRWGQKVYESSDNNGWDGKTKESGDPIQEVYLYVVEFDSDCGSPPPPLVGDLTVIR